MEKHMVWGTVFHKHNFYFVLFMPCVCNAFQSVHAALWSPDGKGLTSGLSLSLSQVVFWVRCDT